MEEENDNEITTKIDIEALDPQTAELNIDETTGEELIRFERREVQAPPDMVFKGSTYFTVLEGFTAGALKNLISFTVDRIRLYEVTIDSIRLISCSKIPEGKPKKLLNDHTLRYALTMIPCSESCSIQILPYTGNRSAFLVFDPVSGELIDTQKFIIFGHTFLKCKWLIEAQKHNCSRIESYMYALASSEDDSGFMMRKELFVGDIGKFRGGRFRRWLSLSKSSQTLIQREADRYEDQVYSLRYEIRENSTFLREWKSKTYRWTRASSNLTLILSRSSLALFANLVDLNTKKVLKSNCLNIIDILGGPKIEKILDGYELHRMLGHGPGMHSGPPHQASSIKLKILDAVFLRDQKAVILLIQIKDSRQKVRIDNIFERRHQKKSVIVRPCRLPGDHHILKNFGEDKILALWSGPIRRNYSKPLAWIDPQTLKEERLRGFEENKSYSLMSHDHHKEIFHHVKLCQSRVLIINSRSALIYDFEEGRLVAEQRHTLYQFPYSNVVCLGDIYTARFGQCLDILKTKKVVGDGSELKEVVKDLKTIYFNDYYNNLSSSTSGRRTRHKLFKLLNGNYLFCGSVNCLRGGRESPHNPKVDEISIEIDHETLEVVNFFRKDFSDELLEPDPTEKMWIVKNFLVFSSKVNKALPRFNQLSEPLEMKRSNSRHYSDEHDDYQSLILATIDYKILDHCRKTQLNRFSTIMAVRDSSIISLGITKTAYLHQVDSETKKLVLLKSIILESGSFLRIYPFSISLNSFCALVERDSDDGEDEAYKLLLRFDMGLDLQSALKIRQSSVFREIYGVSSSGAAFCWKGSIDGLNRIYLADFERKEVSYVTKFMVKHMRPNYLEDEVEGRSYCLEMMKEALVKVYLH